MSHMKGDQIVKRFEEVIIGGTAARRQISKLIDDCTLVSTVTSNLGKISTETLKKAHVQQNCGRVIGKNVLYGFHCC